MANIHFCQYLQDQLRMRRDILSIPEAIQEMTQIIDPGKFFSVSNYATLDDIRASPEQGLIGAEGKKDFIKLYTI